jgi:hypothetical protein
MREPEGKSILINFSESGEPEFFFNAVTDEKTRALQEWVGLNLCGRPAGLSGSALTAPGPASLLRKDDHDVEEVPPENGKEKAGQV